MILKNLAIIILSAGSALAQLHPRVSALTTFNTQVVPLVIIGEGWSQRIVLTDVDSSNVAAGTVQFFTQAGQPWAVNLTTGAQNSIFAFSLQPWSDRHLRDSRPAEPADTRLGARPGNNLRYRRPFRTDNLSQTETWTP